MPASDTSGQPSYPRKHAACWASPQTSHTVCRTQCHGAWTPAPLSTCLSRVGMHGVSNRDTHLCSSHDSSSVNLITTSDVWRSGRIIKGMRSGGTTLRDPVLSSPTPAPTLLEWPIWKQRGSGFTCSVLDVGRFRSCLHKWGMAPFPSSECGAEEQTVDRVVLECSMHRPPHGLHGQIVLHYETIEWLFNTCPDIWCGQAVSWRTESNDENDILSRGSVYS